MGEFTIQDLLPKDGKYTFLVGAGISRDSPSNLPLGQEMMDVIVRHVCAESEVDKILKLENLRFELLVEIIRNWLDPNLKIIDFYGLCDKPNSMHFYLAEMMKRGNFVMTTNFDHLIEYALLHSKVRKRRNIPVITEEDFKKYSKVPSLVQKGYFPVYKIHGSPRNVITDTPTKDSLIATIQAFGLGKKGESVFQLEPFKRPVFENLSNNRTLVVMGYSGSDDFDVVPTLKQLSKLRQIIWIDHAPKGTKPFIQEIQSDSKIPPNDKVGQILKEIRAMGHKSQVFRIKVHTSEAAYFLKRDRTKVSQSTFKVDPTTYLKQEIKSPDQFLEYEIPFEIYNSLSMVEDAERCARIMLERTRSEPDLKWQSISLNNIGTLLYNKGELNEALSYYEKALKIDVELDDLKGKAIRLNNIGLIWQGKGEENKALQQYKEALTISEKLGDLQGMAAGLNNIGMLYYERGELDDALTYYKEALTIAELLGDLRSKSNRINSIGLALYGKGELDEAMTYYKEALVISEQLSDLRGKATRINNIGLVLHDKGELDDAMRYYEEALTIAEQLDDRWMKSGSLNNIGSILQDKGELDKALHYYKGALAIDEQLSYLRGKALDLDSIGGIFIQQGKLRPALDYLIEALSILEQIGAENSSDAANIRETITEIKLQLKLQK